MKVLRRGQAHDCGVSPLFDRPVSAESSCNKTKVEVCVQYKRDDPFVKRQYYVNGVRLLAGNVGDIDGKEARHFWACDLAISDLCEIVRAIRLAIEQDKSGQSAKHYSSLIGEFAQTVATAIEGIRMSEGKDSDNE